MQIKKRLKGELVHHTIVMVSGTAIAQVILLLLTPIITRLYGPTAFGVMGMFKAIIGILVPIAALTYPIAIVLPKENKDAHRLIQLSFLLCFLITLSLMVLIHMFHTPIINVFHLESVGSFLYFVPLAVFFAGIFQIMEHWLIRTKQFRILSKTAIYQAISIQGIEAGVGFIYPSVIILIVMTMLTDFAKLLFSSLLLKGKYFTHFSRNDWPSIKRLAWQFRDFPIFRAPEVFLSAASLNIPILLLSVLFNPISAGFFAISKNVLNIPAQLIGKSVGDAFYPLISEKANSGEKISSPLMKTTITLTLIGLIPFGIIFAVGPWLFGFVFGNDWVTAGEYARWLGLWAYAGFVNRPCIKALPILRAQAFHLRFTILHLIVQTIMLVAGYQFFASDVMAVMLFSISGALLYIYLIIKVIFISQKFDHQHQE